MNSGKEGSLCKNEKKCNCTYRHTKSNRKIKIKIEIKNVNKMITIAHNNNWIKRVERKPGRRIWIFNDTKRAISLR